MTGGEEAVMTGGEEAVTTGLPVATRAPAVVRVCALADLAVERGAAALVQGQQVAVVRLADDTVHAVSQRDPFSGANVMSRGIVGTRRGEPTIASPMYKQVFSLRTGECLDAAGRQVPAGAAPHLRTWPVQVRDGVVYLLLTEADR